VVLLVVGKPEAPAVDGSLAVEAEAAEVVADGVKAAAHAQPIAAGNQVHHQAGNKDNVAVAMDGDQTAVAQTAAGPLVVTLETADGPQVVTLEIVDGPQVVTLDPTLDGNQVVPPVALAAVGKRAVPLAVVAAADGPAVVPRVEIITKTQTVAG